jgi:hypothetical protein
MSDKLTVYSTNKESFQHNSFCDLLHELASEGELEVGRKYYSVEATDVTPGKYICVDAVLEQLDEYVYEDIGEQYDMDFSNAPRHAKDELKVFMLNWARRYIALNYWKFDNRNIKQHVITAEDIVGWE